MVCNDHHLLVIGQIDPHDRVRHRHQLAKPIQSCVPLRSPRETPLPLLIERPPLRIGTPSPSSASGGRSYVAHQHAECLSTPPRGRSEGADDRICNGGLWHDPGRAVRRRFSDRARVGGSQGVSVPAPVKSDSGSRPVAHRRARPSSLRRPLPSHDVRRSGERAGWSSEPTALRRLPRMLVRRPVPRCAECVQVRPPVGGIQVKPPELTSCRVRVVVTAGADASEPHDLAVQFPDQSGRGLVGRPTEGFAHVVVRASMERESKYSCGSNPL
jgi:hypothetical protein